jgi:hypothetical protein
MQKREKVTLIFWLFLSFFICLESLRLGVGSLRAPGPGFLTFGVSLFIILSVCLLFLKKIGRKFAGNVAPLFKGKKIRDVIYASIALFGYALLLDRLGFFLCTLFFTGFCLKIVSPHSWRVVLGMSIIVAIFSYFIFDVWLTLQLPKGAWPNQLFSLSGVLWK